MSEISKPSQPDDLDWIAYQYVEGLLPAEQAAAFEDRLGEDSAAQDALIRTVELLDCLKVIGMSETREGNTSSVGAVEAVPFEVSRHGRSESTPWIVEHWRVLSIALSLGVVAVTLVVISIGGDLGRGEQQAENRNAGSMGSQSPRADVDEQDVIYGWVETSQTLAAFQGQSEAEPVELSLVSNEVPEWLARLDDDENVEVEDADLESEPDWMVLALEGMTFEDESIDGAPSNEPIQ